MIIVLQILIALVQDAGMKFTLFKLERKHESNDSLLVRVCALLYNFVLMSCILEVGCSWQL
jgi:hypothetical protein